MPRNTFEAFKNVLEYFNIRKFKISTGRNKDGSHNQRSKMGLTEESSIWHNFIKPKNSWMKF